MNHLFVAALLALIVTWALSKFLTRPAPEVRERMKHVRGVEARDLVARGVLVVDVVTPMEFAQAHLPGALNIPVAELSARLTELEGHEEVLVYCRSGVRSKKAARIIAETGRKAYDLGPMRAY